ncbi:MAG: tetratricopeptide repeat protein, partial [Bacteroidia bacterium]
MTPSKKGKQKSAILKLIFLGFGLFVPFLARTQAPDTQLQAQQADSLERLQAYGLAAAIYTELGVLAEEQNHLYRSAQRHLQAAECWYFEDPNEMYVSLYMADSMCVLSGEKTDTLSANIANSWGKLYYKFGYPDEARSYYEQALSLRQKLLPSDHADLMGSYNNLGLVAYFYEDDYRQALIYYRRALRIAAQNAQVPKVWQARLHANLARTFNSLDLQDSVDLALQRSLQFYQADGLRATHPDLIDLQLEICRSRIDRADFGLAERMLEAYVTNLQDDTLPLATRKKLPLVLELQGDLYKAKRDWQRAEDAYLRAQASYERYPADNPIVALKLPQRLAEVALLQGDLTRSEEIYLGILQDSTRLDRATAQSISLNLSQLYELMDRPDDIRAQLAALAEPEKLDAFNRSRYFLMQARLSQEPEAENLYLQAEIEMQRAFTHHPELSSLYWEMANWYGENGQPMAQAEYLELALHANLREEDKEILSLPQQVRNLSSMGRYLQSKDMDFALSFYLEADSLLNLLGLYYPAEESRGVLRGNLGGFYGDAVALLFANQEVLRDAERLEQAYQLVEKSRANLLRERQQELAIFEQALAPALQDSLWEAQSRLAHLRNQWFAADSSQKLPLKSRIATAKEACFGWNEQLAAANP